MLKKTPILTSLLSLVLAGCVSLNWGRYDPASLDAMTPSDWKEDLETLAADLRRLHGPTLYHSVSESDFAVELDQAQTRADTYNSDQMLAELHRLLALVHEGHTGVNASPDLYYPIGLRWYPEGVYVVRAESSRTELLGRRVLSVGGLTIAELEAAIDPLINVDMDEGRPVVRPSVVANTRLMRGLGIAGADGLVLDLEGHGEALITPLGPDDTFDSTTYLDTLPQDALPVSLRPRGEPWWYDLNQETGLLYVRYDSCDLAAAPMFDEVVEHLQAGRATKMVLDLRWNGGGNSRPGTDFASAVAGIAGINRAGSLYVLIGPRTFSSAMMNAMDFRATTEAILAGESLVEPAGHYGEVKRFLLPHSGLVIGTSSRYFDYSLGLVEEGQDPSTWVLEPHAGWAIPWTWTAWSGGVDPVLDAVSSAP